MTTPVLHPAASADRLTTALRRSGVLDEASVTDVAVLSARDTIVSHIVRLGLSYDAPAPKAPQSLILKLAHANFADTLSTAGRQEVAFYTKVAPAMPAGLTPCCFDSDWNAKTKTWHLLLEDLTETHEVVTEWPLLPTGLRSHSIVRALGRAHAVWWDHPDLGTKVGTWTTPGAMRGVMKRFTGHLARWSDFMGDRLPPARRDLYHRLIDATPRLMRRDYSQQNVTIVHGDAHVWNFLVPKDATRDDVRLFDFDRWRISVGAGDLAYMMGLQWYPDRRRALEQPLLDLYHETLLAGGVKGYDRRALDDDYRNEVLWHITSPVWQWSVGIPPVIWWNNLERIFLAVDDLNCRELLD